VFVPPQPVKAVFAPPPPTNPVPVVEKKKWVDIN